MRFDRAQAGVVLAVLAYIALPTTVPRAGAQVTGGTITGIVTDPSGLATPEVEVQILNKGTGISRTVETNDRGLYTAPNLDSGNYTLTFLAKGFETAKTDVVLTVGQEAAVNIGLTIGASTSIEVKAEAAQIDTASSSTSSTVGGQTVRELPLNGRDWTSLASLEPGVHSTDAQVATASGSNARANRGWGQEFSIGGNRPQQNNYRLDGVSLNDYSGSGPGDVLGLSLGVDSIQEFSVVTGNAPAEYGLTSGGVINAITRAGTNEIHGSVYEFLRNSAMDARNYFDGTSVPPFKRNQFGGAVGGPIIKNKTFFFFNYEGMRQGLSTTTVDTVPSLNARQGILTTGTVTINPLVTPFLAIFPKPNGPQSGDYGTYSFVSESVTNEDLYTARIDHTFSDKDAIHGTFLYNNSLNTAPDVYDVTLLGEVSNRRLATIEESHIFGPSLANFARFGFNRSITLAPETATALNPLGTDPSLGFAPGSNIGELQITGITTFAGGLNSEGTYAYHYNTFQFYDDLFWTRGAHSLKFGGSIQRIQSNELGSTTTGYFVFGSFSNFLQDIPSTFSSAVPGATTPIYLRQTAPAVYAQDDWHLRPNLTLNLGLRYEMATVPTEAENHLSVLPSLGSPQPHLGSPYFYNPTTRDFAPRIGVAWDPFGTGKTAIRAAYGIYDTLPLTYQFSLLALNTEPYALTASLTKPPKGSFPTEAYQLAVDAQTLRNVYIEQHPKRSYVEQWSVNLQQQMKWDTVLQAGYNGSHGVHQVMRDNDANIVLPTDPGNTSDLVWPTPGMGTRLNPTAGTIDTLIWDGSNVYDALTARVSRSKKGLRVEASYTWSKSIDISSSSIAGSQYNNSLVAPLLFWPSLFRGLSDFNVAHSFIANTLWEVPGPRYGVLGKIAGGWQWGGILTARTGLPFTATIGGDPLGLGNNNPFSLPDRLTGPGCSDLVNPGNPHRYINVQCFAFPTAANGALQPNRLGNSGRNILTAPGLVNLDTSLIKNIPVTERIRAQFRAEAFNVLNHTNFGTPNRASAQLFGATGAPVATAGTLTSTSTSSRQMQLALKFMW